MVLVGVAPCWCGLVCAGVLVCRREAVLVGIAARRAECWWVCRHAAGVPP